MPEEKKKSANRPSASARPKLERRGWRAPYLVASAIVAAVVVLVGVAYYQQYIAPFQRVVITIDGTKIKMREFLDRARLSGSGGLGTLQNLTNEYMIRAGTSALGIAVNDQDIDAELRKQAAGTDNVTVSDAEFKEWYRQLLDSNKMSNQKYRESVKSTVLAARLQEYINTQIPPAIEHAHVYAIFVPTYEEAQNAKERIAAGESFSKVAGEVSIDETSKEKGGELEWVPRGALINGNMDPFMVKVGEVSDPLAIVSDPESAPSTYYVITVTEIADREIQPAFLPEVRNTRFQEWLTGEQAKHVMKWNYNSEIDAWVNWQLTKNSPSGSSPSGSNGG